MEVTPWNPMEAVGRWSIFDWGNDTAQYTEESDAPGNLNGSVQSSTSTVASVSGTFVVSDAVTKSAPLPKAPPAMPPKRKVSIHSSVTMPLPKSDARRISCLSTSDDLRLQLDKIAEDRYLGPAAVQEPGTPIIITPIKMPSDDHSDAETITPEDLMVPEKSTKRLSSLLDYDPKMLPNLAASASSDDVWSDADSESSPMSSSACSVQTSRRVSFAAVSTRRNSILNRAMSSHRGSFSRRASLASHRGSFSRRMSMASNASTVKAGTRDLGDRVLDGDSDAEDYIAQYDEPKKFIIPEAFDENKRRGNVATAVTAGASEDIYLQLNLTSNLPVLEGSVLKDSASWFKGQQARWFVLRNRRLYWYSSQQASKTEKPLGIVEFDLIQAELETLWDDDEANAWFRLPRGCIGDMGGLMGANKTASFRICPVGIDSVMQLSGNSHAEALEWIEVLQMHIEASTPTMDTAEVKSQSKFWKFDHISPTTFANIAETGDIILFTSTEAKKKKLRRGYYDHVALVLRLADGQLAFLEVTGDGKISIVKWSEFVQKKWYELYCCMSLRRVDMQRTRQNLQDFQDFVQGIVGKPFRHRYRIIPRNAKKKAEMNFQVCAELVAKCLMQLGVLPQELERKAQFWPTSFAMETTLPTLKGTAFGYEARIDWAKFGTDHQFREFHPVPRACPVAEGAQGALESAADLEKSVIQAVRGTPGVAAADMRLVDTSESEDELSQSVKDYFNAEDSADDTDAESN